MLTYADLLDLVDQAEVITDDSPAVAIAVSQSATGADALPPVTEAPEADDDPHRLARVNLERYATRTDGRTLRYWRDEWYVWKRNRYVRLSERELRMKLAQSIKEEFDRVCVAKQEQALADGSDPPVSQKVTLSIVSNVLQATGGLVCVPSEIEPNTWLPTRERRRYVSMANGLLDIQAVMDDRDDYLQPNTPQWWSMVSLPYDFDPSARCPRWDAFMEYNLEMDPERIKVCQEWAGYLLLPGTDEQKFMILEGEGRNGKSVFIAGLTAMLGEENVSCVPLEMFGDKFSLYSTIGKLCNAAGDCGDLDKAAEGTLKSFTSGDRMTFDRKGLTPINASPTARLMIACNNRPRFSDRSDGVFRRMLVVPWQVEITAEKRIRGMDKVAWWQASGELPGIFRWALAGLARLLSQGGFTKSAAMEEALMEYKEEMNPARCFLKENVEHCPGGAIRSSVLYRIYRRWADEGGYHPLSERSFGKEVKRAFRQSQRVQRGGRNDREWVYAGLAFNKDDIAGEKTSDGTLF